MENRAHLITSLFSTREFVGLWCRSAGVRATPYELALPDAPSLYGVSCRDRWGRQRVELGPDGLYARISADARSLDHSAAAAVSRLQRLSVESFRWNLRFDDINLKRPLAAAGLRSTEGRTHVLWLETGYSALVSRYSPSIRNHIRRAARLGVDVSLASDEREVHRYYAIHEKLAAEKKNYPRPYPVTLFEQLLTSDDMALFLVARVGGEVAAGGVFFLDNDSLMYWHGATDRRFSKYYPACALFDRAIFLAIERGLTTFNFGASGAIASLEHFKSLWGAQQVPCTQFYWQNPFWKRVQSIKCRLAGSPA